MSNCISHINPSIPSQIPLSFPKLHLERSQSISHPLLSQPRGPALHPVPAESLCSLLPSHFSYRLLSPRAASTNIGQLCTKSVTFKTRAGEWSCRRARRKEAASAREIAVVCVRPLGGVISKACS